MMLSSQSPVDRTVDIHNMNCMGDTVLGQLFDVISENSVRQCGATTADGRGKGSTHRAHP